MKVLTFGEIMLRLKALGHERFFQSPMLEATFGGGEANVAVSLANYGMDAEFLTVLPQNDIADACIRELRYFGVGTKKIVRGEGRMGIYYLEGGANQLPSKVVYDRAYSSIALAKPGDIDWDKAFEGVDWFHITGITPAISESAMELSLESVKEAKKRNITVSCDLNYRKTSGNMAKRPVRSCASLPSTSMWRLPTKRTYRSRWKLPLMSMSNLASWIAKSTARSAIRSWKAIRT